MARPPIRFFEFPIFSPSLVGSIQLGFIPFFMRIGHSNFSQSLSRFIYIQLNSLMFLVGEWENRLENRKHRNHLDFFPVSNVTSCEVSGLVDGVPYAFFGHSLGALVAYETARLGREIGTSEFGNQLLSYYIPHLIYPPVYISYYISSGNHIVYISYYIPQFMGISIIG